MLLRGIHGDTISVDTASGPLQLSQAMLDPLWSGDFLLLWQRPIPEAEITPQMKGASILWLRRQLAQVEGKTLTGALPTNFGPELRSQLARFQAARGIAEDGVAGPRTLLLLANLAPKPGTPSLEDAQ